MPDIRRRLLRLVHRAITYGEAPGYRQRILEEWDQHVVTAAAHNDQRSDFIRSVSSYLHARMTDGPKTLIPTGLCLLIGSLAAFSIALSGVSPEIAVWRQTLLAAALLVNAYVVLRSPISPNHSTLALSLGLLAITAPLPISQVKPVVPADYVLIAGWTLVSLGALAFAMSLIFDKSKVQAAAVWVLAIGFFGVGIANASWTNIASSIGAAVSCALAGIVGLIGAWSTLRLNELGSRQSAHV